MPLLPLFPSQPSPEFITSLANDVLLPRASHVHRDPTKAEMIASIVLIPTLVILSGIFSGLTLGYMSLDETQLHVLRVAGTPEEREYAARIEPVRKNTHLLLVTLLLANMITNETLPIIANTVLGDGVQSVVVSTVLIVIFAEILPQSICTRHGLYIGAKMAPFMHVLLYTLGTFAWPVSRVLEYTLGPHRGLIYRRNELKELVALHALAAEGDLLPETARVVRAAFDAQDKTAQDAMTAASKVFMLSVDARMNRETMDAVCAAGHKRIPVYEDIAMRVGADGDEDEGPVIVRKIVGILALEQCASLDPALAVPLSDLHLAQPVIVARDEPLMDVLERLRKSRNRIAIVSRMTVGEVARNMDADEAPVEASEKEHEEDSKRHSSVRQTKSCSSSHSSTETVGDRASPATVEDPSKHMRTRRWSVNLDPAVAPLGMITLEDVLEHLVGGRSGEPSSVGKEPVSPIWSPPPDVSYIVPSPSPSQPTASRNLATFVRSPSSPVALPPASLSHPHLHSLTDDEKASNDQPAPPDGSRHSPSPSVAPSIDIHARAAEVVVGSDRRVPTALHVATAFGRPLRGARFRTFVDLGHEDWHAPSSLSPATAAVQSSTASLYSTPRQVHNLPLPSAPPTSPLPPAPSSSYPFPPIAIPSSSRSPIPSPFLATSPASSASAISPLPFVILPAPPPSPAITRDSAAFPANAVVPMPDSTSSGGERTPRHASDIEGDGIPRRLNRSGPDRDTDDPQ